MSSCLHSYSPVRLSLVAYFLILSWIIAFSTADNGSPVPQSSVSGWVPFDVSQFNRNTTLQTGNGKRVFLFWSFDNSTNQIEFGVASNNGPTWVAVGVSQSRGMRGASIFVGPQADDNVHF